MNRAPALFRWLALAALVDWLVTRTFTRMAIFMPKPPPVISAYRLLGYAGQLAANISSLLVLIALGWIAWQTWQHGRTWQAIIWLGLPIWSLIFLFTPATGWFAVGYHVLLLSAIILTTGHAWQPPTPPASLLARLLPALALLLGGIYQTIPTLYEALHWPGPPPLTTLLFNIGELSVALSSFVLWWAYGRRCSRATWLVASLPALAFSALYLAMPAMAGILAIWSIGLTLYLPWPIYALSLWLAGGTAIGALRHNDPSGWAIILLAAGGYAPQLSTQAFLGLIALWLLAAPHPHITRAATDQPPASTLSLRDPLLLK